MRGIVIAIDGPAGSGKSTTARAIARHLGYRYLDTGATYRALALKCTGEGIPLDDEARIVAAARAAEIAFVWEGESPRVTLDGEDVTGEIRSQAISDGASKVATFPAVRKIMVARQREIGGLGGVVAEGRDTTTVVFPDAGLKIYMDADLEVRASRRMKELAPDGGGTDLLGIMEDLKARDRRDTGRKASPLSVAPDAVRIDTSSMTIDEQVGAVLRRAREVLEGGVKR